MEVQHPMTEDASALWDWGDLLDFSVDDPFTISFDSDHNLEVSPSPEPLTREAPDAMERVRKRDPRLTCENFLAGRIPCACPELDEMILEEGAPGKKRVRTARPAAGRARCQVTGCEADISELKGYHRRHRVCLRCANASVVILDGQNKRYCQQCGKFHILSDFDEGKRSCRRKLERHNNRRRRKPIDSGGTVEKEIQGELISEDAAHDGEADKDSLCLSSQLIEREPLLESEDGHFSTLCSVPGSQNIQSDGIVSFVGSGEAQIDGGKNDSKYTLSSSYCDNKSAYSSPCPTGRISFKLYDWNPAEFPRRLRHQIFQWLASMPIELEGYIRPGCIILTIFIAMPKFMWDKLLEDPASYVHNFVAAPGKILSGRGNVLVYLNNMIFRVTEDGTSVMKVEVKMQAPKLHYVHPNCFEAGKPMEFVACGSNLLRPKFRFLVSFAGKYLSYDYHVVFPRGKIEGGTAGSLDHEFCKIYIPHTEPNAFGPAFIEVENDHGLSNFIPIFIGDKEICSEMKILQHRFDASLCSKGSQFFAKDPSDSCKVSVLGQTAFSEFILDIAWILKEPASENIQRSLTSSHIQRFNCLLNFLIHNESTTILEKILQSLKVLIDNMDLNIQVNGATDTDLRLLYKYMDHASKILHQKLHSSGGLVLHSGNSVTKGDHPSCFHNNMLPVIFPPEDTKISANSGLAAMASSTSTDRSETVSLLNREVVMNMNSIKEQPRKSCSLILSKKAMTSRPFLYMIVAAAACFGICAVLLHPHEVGKLAVSIRRCLFDNS